jgi:large subunit ribosomal protein L25
MQESFVVEAETRTLQGKGASRRLRREGKVPVILYGAKENPQLLSVSQNELLKHLKIEAFYSHILTLQVDGETPQQAVLKDLQRHPVREFILHMDLLRVRADQLLRMSVPLHFHGGEVCPGVKTGGGIVEHHVNAVEVECLPGDLPQYIEVDLSALNVNESVHLSQLQLPDGVSLTELKHGTDRSVAAVHLPRAAVEAEAAAEGAAAEAAAAAGAEAKAAEDAKKDEKK